MRNFSRHHPRGFTLIELLMVISIIGILAAVSIPGYQRLTARSHRTEMLELVSKFRSHFRTVYESQGTFASPETMPVAGSTSAMNPDPALSPIGEAAPWDPNRTGWTQMPYVLDGGVRMRYWYVLGPDVGGRVNDVTFFACANFPGFGPATLVCLDGVTGNYRYSETFHAGGDSDAPVELPSF